MCGNGIEDLKRKIKRTYKRYIKERTDKEATLSDVAKFFNIKIDETRVEDYVVKKIDYSTPSIEIIDKKDNSSYSATYTGDAEDLLNYFGPIEFNKVVHTRLMGKEESIYYIGSETPIVTEMTFKGGDYELVFRREMPNSARRIFINDKVIMSIRYLQNIVYKGNNVKQPLFSKIYEYSDRNYKCDEVFERKYTYGPQYFIERNGSSDKYAYVSDNNVIYGINNWDKDGLCEFLRGICFESTDVVVSNYLPRNMREENYPLLKESNINSAMLFKARTADKIRHSLQIYKSDAISIIYNSEKRHFGKSYQVETIANEEYGLPNLSDGTITSEEIRKVLSSLRSRLGDNTFIDIISEDLNIFGTKIDVRKELIKETTNLLDSKLFINKSFDEIYNLVGANKDEYFNLIRKQFEAAANINDNSLKEKPKVLRK